MNDGMFDRQYQAGREALNASLTGSISHLGRLVSDAFQVLNRIEYQAPWATKPKRARCS